MYRDARIYLAMTAPGSVEEDDSILLHFVNFFVIVGCNYLNGFVIKKRVKTLKLILMEGVTMETEDALQMKDL